MSEFNVVSKKCPVCGAAAVELIDNNISLKRRPRHHCTKCGAKLTTQMTLKALWCAPALGIAILAMWLTIPWLQHASLHPGLRTALIGGLGGLAVSFPFRVLSRAIVFRPWTQ